MKYILRIYVNKVEDKHVLKIIERLLEIIEDTKLREHNQNIRNTIVVMRKKANLNSKKIDCYVELHMKKYFETDYSMEISHSKKKMLMHLDRYIALTNSENAIQGKNGVYHGFSNCILGNANFLGFIHI